MKVHKVKCDPQSFKEILEGNKKCDLRFNDRDFKTGDILLLEETERSEADRKKAETNTSGLQWTKVEHRLTGRTINALITHVIDSDNPWGGLEKGWVILSLHGSFIS